MKKIDIFNLSKYLKNTGDNKLARIGHVNHVIGTTIPLPANPQNGDALVYNSTTGLWEPGSVGGVDEYTETIVTIGPNETTYSDGRPLVASGVLTMGTSPIELLPEAGVNNYYDINEIFLEYTYNGTPYTLPAKTSLTVNGDSAYSVIDNILLSTSSNVYIIKEFSFPYDSTAPGVQELTPQKHDLNANCQLVVSGPGNPTLGDGTLRVIIKYNIRTFGA